MSQYILEIISYKTQRNTGPYNFSDELEKINVTEAEIFEAISKYLQVKGFTTEKVSVYEHVYTSDSEERDES